jgi:hypothetical protein
MRAWRTHREEPNPVIVTSICFDMKPTSVATSSQKSSLRYRKWDYNLYLFYGVALVVKPLDDPRSMPSKKTTVFPQ